MPHNITLDCGQSRTCTYFQLYGPDGHSLMMEGPATVARWEGKPPRLLVFGRTFAEVVEGYRPQSPTLVHDEATITDKGARLVVRYALRRGWQVTECTAGHPLADILPEGWGAP